VTRAPVATFADLLLLQAVPSYGGAEVLRARRVLPSGTAPPLHLALFGAADAALCARLVAVADAVAAASHDQILRIHEIGIRGGDLFALAEAFEAVPLLSVLERQRQGRAPPDVGLSLAVALQLATIAHELLDRSEVWDVDGGAGLCTLFPAGLRLEAVHLRRDGRVLLVPLATAAADPAQPSAFRAPELSRGGGGGRSTAASDVFLVTQTLRALAAGDAQASSAPRLGAMPGGLAAELGPLLAAGLSPRPDERLGLFMLLERLDQLSQALGGGPPTARVAAALEDDPGLAPRVPVGPEPAPAALEEAAARLRRQLLDVRARLEIAWPRQAPPAGMIDPSDLLVETAVLPRSARDAETSEATSDAVDRVFTEEKEALFDSDREPFARVGRAPAGSARDAFLDIATLHDPFEDEGPPPLTSDFEAESTTQGSRRADVTPRAPVPAPPVEARAAPPPTPSELEQEALPTVEMQLAGARPAPPPPAAAPDPALDPALDPDQTLGE
jgi:hypothetical protein